MTKSLLAIALALLIFSQVNGQDTAFETLTYKTKSQTPRNPTLFDKIFGSKNTVTATIPKEQNIVGRVLVKGKISLYEVNAYPGQCNLGYGTNPFYFIKTEDGETVPLIHHEQIGAQVVSQPYIGMLRYCLRKWDESESYITEVPYSTESLSRLIEKYNYNVATK
ncbi:hypothetical protein F0919_13225 [Taibaiella lutea]|uniref:DUF4468 domain-containing protein n=1 Tax=Taibaiella lutea TaxID=2608001 RepID=A0A5M6CEL8_9BACT|nr:hypothetical protein [Taibaiella lutea]KAA5533497.1 hypothetical protein F0919_13225 [Taibaiella lutea]